MICNIFIAPSDRSPFVPAEKTGSEVTSNFAHVSMVAKPGCGGSQGFLGCRPTRVCVAPGALNTSSAVAAATRF